MKKFSALIIAGMFIVLVSCGPRDNSQNDQQYEQDTIPDTELQDQNSIR